MRNNRFIETFAARFNLPMDICEQWVHLVFNHICHELLRGEEVRIKNVGTLCPVIVPAKTVRSNLPVFEGLPLDVPEKIKIQVRPSKQWAKLAATLLGYIEEDDSRGAFDEE
jgi:nucleoid DNA-binding protein